VGVEQLLDVSTESGVRRGNAQEVARSHIPGWQHGAASIDNRDDVLRRDSVASHFLGIDLDHDGPLAAAEGGGAETPGSVAKIGRTRFSAMSCISPGVRVALEKTSCATGTLPASNRMMKAGPHPEA